MGPRAAIWEATDLGKVEMIWREEMFFGDLVVDGKKKASCAYKGYYRNKR